MKNIKKYIILLVIVISLGIFLNISFTFGKYVNNQFWNYYFRTKGFYFMSDELKENIELEYWDENNVYINLKNFKNESLVTEYDIEYEATCIVLNQHASDVECLINDTLTNKTKGTLSSEFKCVNGEEVIKVSRNECLDMGYNYISVPQEGIFHFNLMPNHDDYVIDEAEVELIVKSISPYKKTIKSNYILKNNLLNNEILYDIKSTEYLVNIIFTNEKHKSELMEISWDEKDLTLYDDKNISEKFYKGGIVNKVNLTLNENSSKMLTFFIKNKEKKYDLNSFVIKSK